MRPGSFFALLQTRRKKIFTKSNWYVIGTMVRSNLKAHDHNSVFGIMWSLLGPACLLIVMYLVVGTRFSGGAKTYPLYLLIGIVSISFFIAGTTFMANVFSSYRRLALNSTIPRENFILSTVFIHTYKFIIELVICGILSAAYGLIAWQTLVFMTPLFIAFIALVLGIGLILSLIYCFARDIRYIWSIVARVLLFATPIFYTLDRVSPFTGKIIYWVNPLTPFLFSFQTLFLKPNHIDPFIYLHSLLLGCSFFIAGYAAFIIFENRAVERA